MTTETSMTLPPVRGGWKKFLIQHCDNKFAWEPWLYKWLIPYLIGATLVSVFLEPLLTKAGQFLANLVLLIVLVIFTLATSPGINFLFWKKFDCKEGSLKLIQNLMKLGFKFETPGETVNFRGADAYYVKEALEQLDKLKKEVLEGEKEYYSKSTLERVNDNLERIISQESDKQRNLLDEGRLDRLQSDLLRLYTPVPQEPERRRSNPYDAWKGC